MTLHCPLDRCFILSIDRSVVDEANTHRHDIRVRIDPMTKHIRETRRIIMPVKSGAEEMRFGAFGETPANGQRARVSSL